VVLKTLASYLGTGYSFGIHRLAETFDEQTKRQQPAHILVVSDNDIFSMLDQKGDDRLGWDVALEAIRLCGGGGTYVLQLPQAVLSADWPQPVRANLDRMKRDGWAVSLVNTMEELVAFARQFSKANYDRR
jgi:hypothetical protein